MIYGRFGNPVTIKRIAVLADVQKFDGRRPDKHDKANVESGGYVIVDDDGTERLYHQAYLRADDGAKEISKAIEAVKA